jgi:hypothetical protein
VLPSSVHSLQPQRMERIPKRCKGNAPLKHMGRTLKGQSLFLLAAVIMFSASSAAPTWISAVTPSTKTTSVTITWISAVPADSQVKYGLSASSYASRTSLDATRVSITP